MPKPPCTPIAPFPAGYWNYVGCQDELCYAELDWWNKIRQPGVIQFAPEFIIEYFNSYYKSHLGGEMRLLWDIGECESYVLNTSDMNYYLYKTKEVIDDCYPPYPSDLFIGYFMFYCLEFYDPWTGTYMPNGQLTFLRWFETYIGFWMYQKTYIGNPGS